MATELVWYELVDLTSYGIKYPKDWFYRCGHKPKLWEGSVCESLGQYSSEENALSRLKKWGDDKGLDSSLIAQIDSGYGRYYENNLSIVCEPVATLGIWYNAKDEPTTNELDRCYGTAAMVVRKTMELDRD